MRKLVIVLFAGALTLAGCGGDSGNSSENASDNGTVTTKKASSSGGGSSSEFCGLKDKYSELENFQPGGDPAALKTQFQTAKEAIQEGARLAPSEIRTDFRTLATAYVGFVDAMAAVDWDFTKINPQDPAFAKLQDPKIAAAGERVDAWVTAHCGAG